MQQQFEEPESTRFIQFSGMITKIVLWSFFKPDLWSLNKELYLASSYPDPFPNKNFVLQLETVSLNMHVEKN